MAGDPTASVIALVVLVAAGIIAALSKRASRDEVLPPPEVRELTRRLTTSHENLRKRSKKR